MPLREVLRRVIARLEEGDRGDRGWFLITRVHLSPARLRDIVTYLYDVGANEGRELQAQDYNALAAAVGVAGDDPGVTLRRHFFLAMERPLSLLKRVDEAHWSKIRLTETGIDLATSPNTSAVLEKALSAIVFCREPWYTETRVDEYRDFQVHPYAAALEVMAGCDGWVDRDEYDLFLSRVRRNREAGWAIEGILEFRTLGEHERIEVLDEVRRRVPGAKAYQNWRDMGLHTFSLFSLGISAMRIEQRLLLTEGVVEPRAAVARRPAAIEGARRERAVVLRIPTPDAHEGLENPPASAAMNAGSDGELLIGKLLQAAGWRVVFYTNRRGFGFDIWAARADAAIVVEVKSSFGDLGAITLTRLEHDAAQHFGQNYILATVENLQEAPVVRFIQDPIRVLRIEQRDTREYTIAREVWAGAAQPFDPHGQA